MTVNKIADITTENIMAMLEILHTLTHKGNALVSGCVIAEINTFMHQCIIWEVEAIWDNNVTLKAIEHDGEICIFQIIDDRDVMLKYKSWKSIEEIIS